jgi:hypothetical protein
MTEMLLMSYTLIAWLIISQVISVYYSKQPEMSNRVSRVRD